MSHYAPAPLVLPGSPAVLITAPLSVSSDASRILAAALRAPNSPSPEPARCGPSKDDSKSETSVLDTPPRPTYHMYGLASSTRDSDDEDVLLPVAAHGSPRATAPPCDVFGPLRRRVSSAEYKQLRIDAEASAHLRHLRTGAWLRQIRRDTARDR
ncbi:hypothetical protein B0H10DRAFT_2052206 [Mycena sp. CBHHK59/15]|nr:hypothetical protein B0H10DRAFT_2052206 [Mycena sp. CBHHK59/15]